MKFNTALLSKAAGRKNNEDFCSYLEQGGCGCYLVADGLGGHRGGALASQTAGESILEAFAAAPGASEAQLKEYLKHARQALKRLAAKEKGRLTLKTTLVVMLSDFREAVWAHSGDSRLYQFRAGQLNLQTLDHSVPQLLAAGGEIDREQIRHHEDRNRLTGAFDGDENARIEFAPHPVHLETGDAFLLCSDGFWEYVYEPEMEEELARSRQPEIWLDRMEKRLLQRAGSNNDNYTALAVMVR